ncbi:uncharacterized protein LOC126827741 [Patella vulgata]|uniref:uncharacterized protein LOC126827741 n=1 Tax=Patella vulgata TaxID=6465 RepID=UPI00218097CC|nr:uncharacterized protein LOC126827741 [Patella vulgata]XP_050413200.1 uncharacterized protein LOC126827741 [Patella vulgata]
MDNNGFQNLTGSSTVWVGNNPYLVTPSGIIPLTSGLSSLSLGPNQMTVPPSAAGSQGNQYYVVSVQESPTKASPPILNNPRTGLGLYNGGQLTASTPNLGYDAGINNFNNFQYEPQPYGQPNESNFSHGLPGQPYTAALLSGLPKQQLMPQPIPNGFVAHQNGNGNHPQYISNLTNANPNLSQSQRISTSNQSDHLPLVSPSLSSSSTLKASTPNLGYDAGINNFNNLQYQPQPYGQPNESNFTHGLPGQPYTAALFSGLPKQQLMPQPIPNGFVAHQNGNGNPQYISNLTNGNPNLSQSQRTSTTSNQSDHLPLVSPSLSTSSMSIQSESSYGATSSPDTSLNCVYDSSDTLTSNDTTQSPHGLSRSDSLSSAKRTSVGEVFDSNVSEQNKQIYAPVPPCYERPINKECCLKCGKKVYAMEKLGPVKDCLYHKFCFSCVVCGTILNVKNYHVNPNDLEDVNVYCTTHMPSNKSVCVDAASVSIKGALRVPKLNKINEQIRGGPDAMKGNKIDAESVSVKTAMNAPRRELESEKVKYSGHTYNLDAESLGMKHVPVTNLQASNKTRESAWQRNGRQVEGVPSLDVIRYDTPAPEYDYDNKTRRYYYTNS